MAEAGQLPCPHGRASWASCPHRLGINRLPVAADQEQPPAARYVPSDRQPLPSGLLPAERTALTVARSRLKAGDQPPPFITAVLAMTIDRLLGGEGKVTALDGPKLHAFTRDQLIDALRRRMPPAPPDGPVVVLEGDAAFESMADAIIEALEDGKSAAAEGSA